MKHKSIKEMDELNSDELNNYYFEVVDEGIRVSDHLKEIDQVIQIKQGEEFNIRLGRE